MADAANILLNLTRNPYRVQPQPDLFRGRATPDTFGRATRDISSTIAMVQQAKQLADAIAPFLSQEYQPPLQQGEIAAQQLKAAQESAKQLQRTQATEAALATPLPAQVGEMAQPLPSVGRQIESMEDPVAKLLRANEMLQEATTSSEVDEAQRLYRQYQDMAAGRPVRGLDTMPQLSLTGQEQLASGLSTPVSREAMQQQAMGMPEAAPLDTAALDPAGLQQLMQQQQTLGAQQDIAQAQQAVAEAPQMLPTFQTLAEADAALEAASAARDVNRYNQIVAGLQYSPLIDIPAAQTIGDINPFQRRQRAIAELMKRHKVVPPKPLMTAYQQQALDIQQRRAQISREELERKKSRDLDIQIKETAAIDADFEKAKWKRANAKERLELAKKLYALKERQLELAKRKAKEAERTGAADRAAKYARARYLQKQTESIGSGNIGKAVKAEGKAKAQQEKVKGIAGQVSGAKQNVTDIGKREAKMRQEVKTLQKQLAKARKAKAGIDQDPEVIKERVRGLQQQLATAKREANKERVNLQKAYKYLDAKNRELKTAQGMLKKANAEAVYYVKRITKEDVNSLYTPGDASVVVDTE